MGPHTGLHDLSEPDPEEHVHTYRDPDFDQDHNALWGQTITEAKETIGSEVLEHDPDLALLLLGINDLVWFQTSPESLDAELRTYIENARTGNPELDFIMSELLPTARAGEDEEFRDLVADFNQRMNQISSDLSNEESLVTVTDIGGTEGFDVETDTYDGVHPSANGELKIAAAFADALDERYSLGAPYPRPLPELGEEAPVGAPALELREIAPGQIELSWTPVEGASSYWVWVKEPESPEWVRLPYPLSMEFNPWTTDGLLPGGTYEYRLQAAKGNISDDFSNTVTYRISGDLPDPPEAPGQFTVEAGDGEAHLSWEESADATGYYVHVRNLTWGEEDFTRLPYPVTGTEWTAELLLNGAEYEFKLQSAHGFLDGGTSEAVSVTPTGPVPDPPTQLTAEAGNGEVTLRWSESANATGYYVHVRDLTRGEEDFTRLPYPVTGTEWVNRGLVNGADYEFRLSAANGYIEGGRSSTVSATPTVEPPGPPTGLTATAQNAQVKLEWNQAENATAHYIYIKNLTAGETSFTRLPYPIEGNTWTVEALTNGADYQFRVRSMSGLIEGGQSSTVSATPTGPAPSAPTGFSVRSGNREAVLSWNMPDNATCVYVQVRDVTHGESGFTQLPFPVCADSWIATGLVNGATYEYRVRAYNGLIAGGTSSAVSVSPTGPGAAGPEELHASGGDNSAALSWTGASRATGYYVWVKAVTLGEDWRRLPIPLAQTSWISTGLVNGATYQFRIQSVDGYEEGGYSNTVTVTAQGPRPQVSALNVSARLGEATLSWQRYSSADGYYIYLRNRSAGESFVRMPYPVTAGSWTAEYLVPGDTYEFQVLAVSGLQEGARSSVVRATIPRPGTPGGFSATQAGPYAASLEWNRVPGADAYIVYHGVSNSAFEQPTMRPLPYPVTGTSLTASYLTQRGIHWFAIAATKYGAEGSRSSVSTMSPLMTNVNYYSAYIRYFVNSPGHGNTRRTTWAPAVGSNSGILVSRAFIANRAPYGPISDGRLYNAHPGASARMHAAWDASRGRLSALAQRSCVGSMCNGARPISFAFSSVPDGAPLSDNHVWSNTTPNGISITWKAVNSDTYWVPGLAAHIDTRTLFTHQGGSNFSVYLRADHFPTYEVYQYPEYTTNGNPSARTLTRCDQYHINGLMDSPSQRRTCT